MNFYSFVMAAESGRPTDELFIDGAIVTDVDWWSDAGQVVARNFRKSLSVCKDVRLYINSPGGDVFAGADIYTMIREHKGRVTAVITGIAASAASIVAMAADEILISPVGYMMIHDPWTIVAGNARELEQNARVLREIGEGLIAAYQRRTGKSRDEISAMLADETYMSAQTCVDEGFADAILYDEPAAPAVPAAARKPAASRLATARMKPEAVMAMTPPPEGWRMDRHVHRMDGHTHGLPHHTHSLSGSGLPPPGPSPAPKAPDPQDAQLREEIKQRALFIADLYETA